MRGAGSEWWHAYIYREADGAIAYFAEPYSGVGLTVGHAFFHAVSPYVCHSVRQQFSVVSVQGS